MESGEQLATDSFWISKESLNPFKHILVRLSTTDSGNTSAYGNFDRLASQELDIGQ